MAFVKLSSNVILVLALALAFILSVLLKVVLCDLQRYYEQTSMKTAEVGGTTRILSVIPKVVHCVQPVLDRDMPRRVDPRDGSLGSWAPSQAMMAGSLVKILWDLVGVLPFQV